MTIRACRECNKDISTEAFTCPNCGVKDPINKSVELLEVGTDLHVRFGMLVFINIIGNFLLNNLESGFFYWLLIIVIIFMSIGLLSDIFVSIDKYKRVAASEGLRHTLATIYTRIVIVYILIGVGNIAYGLIH